MNFEYETQLNSTFSSVLGKKHNTKRTIVFRHLAAPTLFKEGHWHSVTQKNKHSLSKLDEKLSRRHSVDGHGALERTFPSVHVRSLFLEGERVRKTSREEEKIVTRRRGKQRWHLFAAPPAPGLRGSLGLTPPWRTDGGRGWTAGCSSSAPCTPSPQLASENTLSSSSLTDTLFLFFGGVRGRGGGSVMWPDVQVDTALKAFDWMKQCTGCW